MTIEQLYEQRCLVGSDINEHLPTFVDIAFELEATRVIELGVRGGVSTVAWLYAMEATDGHLWSVDVFPNMTGIEHDRWTFVHGDDLHPATLGQLPVNADIVFIDTSHRYRHTLDELETYSRRVRWGGRIICHDTMVEAPETTGERGYPVWRAIDRFAANTGWRWTNLKNNNGLAIIEVPT